MRKIPVRTDSCRKTSKNRHFLRLCQPGNNSLPTGFRLPDKDTLQIMVELFGNERNHLSGRKLFPGTRPTKRIPKHATYAPQNPRIFYPAPDTVFETVSKISVLLLRKAQGKGFRGLHLQPEPDRRPESCRKAVPSKTEKMPRRKTVRLCLALLVAGSTLFLLSSCSNSRKLCPAYTTKYKVEAMPY